MTSGSRDISARDHAPDTGAATPKSAAPEDGPPTPLGALKFRMEQAGYTQADLARVIGHRGHASEILAGKRDLSKAHIVALADTWGIPARSLLGPDATNWKARALTAEAQLADERYRADPGRLAERLMSWPIPPRMTCDGCMMMPDYPHQRYGTNMIGVSDARAMLEWLLQAPTEPTLGGPTGGPVGPGKTS